MGDDGVERVGGASSNKRVGNGRNRGKLCNDV